MQNMVEPDNKAEARAKHERKEYITVDAIKVFGEQSKQHMRLTAAATLMNAEMEPNDHGQFEVKDIYFDYGQGWKWTTIVFNGGDQWSSYQALNPKQQGMIVYGDLEDFTKTVWAVVERRRDHMLMDRILKSNK